MFEPPHNVVVVVDGPDPDNYICILAALSQFFGMNLAAVIMTGRPVCIAQGAKPYEFNPAASHAVNRDNALHAKGTLMRHGGEHVPVFEGGWATYSTIEQARHIHERVTDVWDDAHAGHILSGNIKDAIRYLADLPGTLHFVCGGPLTDVAHLLYQPMLQDKFGILTAQLGMFGFTNITLLGGGRKQFNSTADPKAVYDVLFDYEGPVYLLSSDFTKLPELAFHSPEEVEALVNSSKMEEVAMMYRQAWPHMWGPRGIPAHMHDFHPAELMSYLLSTSPLHHTQFSLTGDQIGRYEVKPVGIESVPYLPHEIDRWGEIDLGPFTPNSRPRFVTTGIETNQHKYIIAQALNSPVLSPKKRRKLFRS